MGQYWKRVMEAAALIAANQDKARKAFAAGKPADARKYLDTVKDAAAFIEATARERDKVEKGSQNKMDALIAKYSEKLNFS